MLNGQKKLLLITDAWHPQVNGVVRTLETTIEILQKQHNFEVCIIHPEMFKTFSIPFYKEIKLVWNIKHAKHYIENLIKQYDPDYIHVATEGPLGRITKSICATNNYKFTTAYHTHFPDFLQAEFPWIPFIKQIVFADMKNFHKTSSNVMVATSKLLEELKKHKFKKLVLWGRGVDLNLFTPNNLQSSFVLKNYALYVGRVSKEKRVEDFLKLDTKKHNLVKVIVGGGPILDKLMKKYPDAVFVGKAKGETLANYYRHASVFVFPSKADTFGLVIVEALASGVPVAAYSVPNTQSILNNSVGSINDDLQQSLDQALTKRRVNCRLYAEQTFSWNYCTTQFINNLVKVK